MTIISEKFINENELHSWVENNINTFFGDVIYVKGFKVTTRRNKGGIPDGFILDLNNSSWTIIESELISHGVWDHIAEQIVRFIVATQNIDTKKKIRDRFFYEIENRNLIEITSKKLQIPSYKLLEKIENITETTTPDIAIFIDEVNEDLEDMAEAMNATIKIFRIQKYLVNGSIEYLSPESSKSYFETTIEEIKDSQSNPSIAIDLLGGGKIIGNVNRSSIFELNNGDRVITKYSRYYEKDDYYWYAISPQAINKYKQNNLSHILFILENEGFVKLPIDILNKYLQVTKTSTNTDGSVRHYHVYIKATPELLLYVNKNQDMWKLTQWYFNFS